MIMFMVLTSRLEHCESSPGSFDECSTKRHVAANLWIKPTDLSHRPACSLYMPRQLGNYIRPTEGKRLSYAPALADSHPSKY